MDNNYIPVSSNDTLLHLALPGSPETLCGRPVADRERHPSASDVTLQCDTCDTLSGGNSFIKTNDEQEEGITHLASSHRIDINRVPQIILDDTEALNLFHKQAHIHEAYDMSDAESDAADDRADEEGRFCPIHGEWSANDEYSRGQCPKCDDEAAGPGDPHPATNLDTSTPEGKAMDVALQRRWEQTGTNVKENSVRTASNYTRDGIEIKDGFNLMLTTREASEIPYLDVERVTISDKIHCPDCEEDTWLARVASCTDCGELKCDSCMDDSSFNFMLGTCKKCANTSGEEENYFLNSYDDTDYSLIQRASGFFAEEDYDEEATFLITENPSDSPYEP